MRAALELLATLPGRHVAVLGEMYELGEGTEAGHREVGEIAAGLVDLLVVIGAAALAHLGVGAGRGPCARPHRRGAGPRIGAGRPPLDPASPATSSSSRPRAGPSSISWWSRMRAEWSGAATEEPR